MKKVAFYILSVISFSGIFIWGDKFWGSPDWCSAINFIICLVGGFC